MSYWTFMACCMLLASCGQVDADRPAPPDAIAPREPARIIVGAPTSPVTTEHGGSSSFTVVLGRQPGADVVIPIESSDTREARVDTAQLVFTPANWDRAQTITATGVDDDVDDGDRVVTIALRQAISADPAYAAIDPDDVTLTNMDDEVPGIFASPPLPTSKTTEKGGKVTFTLQLRLPPSADVTVPVRSRNVGEGTVDKASVTFTKESWNVPQTITVTGVDDKVADPDEAYAIESGPSVSNDASYDTLSANRLTLTNTDDDEVVQLEIGFFQSCVRFVDGRVKCWGADHQEGSQGYGDPFTRGDDPGEMGDALPYVSLGTGRTAKSIVAAAYHTCAILDDDTLKCWGNNDKGCLGYGDTNHRGSLPGEMGDALPAVDFGGLKVRAVASKQLHSCAILSDASTRCWGLNNSGTLGNADLDLSGRGDMPGEMGAGLPQVALGTGRKATAVAVGQFHSCALLDDATVKCWGSGGRFGFLGQGDDDGRGVGGPGMGDALLAVKVGTGRTVKAITAGERHTCVLLDNAAVKCWGENSFGQLGVGDTRDRGSLPTDMGDSLPAVDLGPGRTAKQIKAGFLHTCAILDDSTVKCWGQNGSGVLGQGDAIHHGSAPGQMGNNLRAVDLGVGSGATALGAGLYAAGVITTKRTVKLWGTGAYGLLGQGSMQTIGDEPGEMGDALPPVLVVGP